MDKIRIHSRTKKTQIWKLHSRLLHSSTGIIFLENRTDNDIILQNMEFNIK